MKLRRSPQITHVWVITVEFIHDKARYKKVAAVRATLPDCFEYVKSEQTRLDGFDIVDSGETGCLVKRKNFLQRYDFKEFEINALP